MSDEAHQLKDYQRASVIAAAGCGKTELIARTAKVAEGRQLILTHTNAGVEAIRRRLRHLGVGAEQACVDTLDGWCIKYVSAYPSLSRGIPFKDVDFIDWPALRKAMNALLGYKLIRKIILHSYSGAFVDEYQDCTLEHHSLIKSLSELIPTRILGDPLQAVFRFRGNTLIEWPAVKEYFPQAMHLKTPWRWRKEGANQDLGDWLTTVRSDFESFGALDLTEPRIDYVQIEHPGYWHEQARDICFALANKGGNVVAISKWHNDCQAIARMTGGLFQCVEPIEAKDAVSMLRQLEGATGTKRADIILSFVNQVASHVNDHRKALRSIIHERLTPNEDYYTATELLRNACEIDSALAIASALDAISSLPGIRVFRRELLWAVLDSLRDVGEGPTTDLCSALRRRRNLSSHIGRRLSRCSAGTTLLVKGMEFDHALVVHTGGPKGFTLNDLYVALTRGAKSLTVLSQRSLINLRQLPRE